MTKSDQGLLIKLFAGFLATSELKMHLAQSKLWKDNLILSSTQPGSIKLVYFREKEYFGKYLPQSAVFLKDLSEIERQLRAELLKVCPKYKQEKLMMRLFSQPFIL